MVTKWRFSLGLFPPEAALIHLSPTERRYALQSPRVPHTAQLVSLHVERVMVPAEAQEIVLNLTR